MNHHAKQVKLLALVSALAAGLLFMENGYASGSGVYLGGLLGYSKVNYTASNQGFDPGSTDSNSGWAWNAHAGYQFTRNVALQADFTDYQDANLKNLKGINGASANYSQKVGDAVGKLIMPIGAFNLNLNAGLAYVALDRSTNDTAQAKNINLGDHSTMKLTYGLGAGYDLSPNLTVIASWQQIPSGSDIEQSNFFGGGLDYYFN